MLLTEKRARITMMPPSDLLKELKEGNIKAIDVLRAFQAKVCISVAFSDSNKLVLRSNFLSLKRPN